MLYFIPAWYQQNRWCESEQNWYVRRERTEFDDTVKQIQLFHRSGAYPYQIMLLSFTPNFRHFLHRQGVYHAPYWSCFDAIQEIKRKKAMVLSFHNLNWPEHIEFVYSPFAALALLHGEKYAQIEFGEDGNPIQVDMYKDGKINRKNIYDDRGFVSQTILYEEGQPVREDYLSENGIWKLRHFVEDGHVEINPQHDEFLISYEKKEYTEKFKKHSYSGMAEVIQEVFTAYVRKTQKEDIFCAAVHELHMKMLMDVLQERKLILSFFDDRYQFKNLEEVSRLVESASHIITDSQENTNKLVKTMKRPIEKITDITPYDSRVDFGISQQLNVQKILVPVDGLEEETFDCVIRKLGTYLYSNENAQVHLFTRLADYGLKQRLLEKTRKILERYQLEAQWSREDTKEEDSENKFEETVTIPIRFFVEQCVDELSVSKCMREQRIFVDMRKNPNLYLQITCISTGIPQIVRSRTQYVEHMRNGMILKDLEKLDEAVDYYLNGLANWNEAMVYSYEIGKQYTTQKLIDEWKEVIKSVG